MSAHEFHLIGLLAIPPPLQDVLALGGGHLDAVDDRVVERVADEESDVARAVLELRGEHRARRTDVGGERVGRVFVRAREAARADRAVAADVAVARGDGVRRHVEPEGMTPSPESSVALMVIEGLAPSLCRISCVCPTNASGILVKHASSSADPLGLAILVAAAVLRRDRPPHLGGAAGLPDGGRTGREGLGALAHIG